VYYDRFTEAEKAGMLSVTRERIRRIEAKGIKKLHHSARIKRIWDYADNPHPKGHPSK
jgi:DNA-directed RNA polymerase sigma subunit (sigma70/sigma32)